jgi:hypothetical protein
LNDPWGDLVNYFRDFSVTRVKFRLVAEMVDQLPERWSTSPIGEETALRVQA